MSRELTDEEMNEVRKDAREHIADFENYSEALDFFIKATKDSMNSTWSEQ